MAIDEGMVLRTVLEELAKEGQRYVPVGISARHVHLCRKDLEILFGEGFDLHHCRDLSQPGQFASQERVTLKGPKGTLENVRVLGPERNRTQVEISLTDACSIGLKEIPVRLSGDLDNTPGIRIEGPKGSIDLPAGVIAAARHVHMSAAQAKSYGIHDGQVIALRSSGVRQCVLEHVICRTGDAHELELHLDTDEANACGLKNGDILEVLIPGECESRKDGQKEPDLKKIAGKSAAALLGCEQSGQYRAQILDLVTEDDVNRAEREGNSCIYCDRKALITPAASDRSAQLGIAIVRADDPVKEEMIHIEGQAEILELVTAQDFNAAFRDDRHEIYCTKNALITPAARERMEETGINVIRI